MGCGTSTSKQEKPQVIAGNGSKTILAGRSSAKHEVKRERASVPPAIPDEKQPPLSNEAPAESECKVDTEVDPGMPYSPKGLDQNQVGEMDVMIEALEAEGKVLEAWESLAQTVLTGASQPGHGAPAAAECKLAQAFNVMDPCWQASKNYAPDKESLWTHPVEKDGWILAHNSIRGEIADIKGALSDVTQRDELQQWEIQAVHIAWSEHKAHVHAHHSNEDAKMSPFLSTRINLPAKLEADHQELLRQMDHIDWLVSGLSAAATYRSELHPFAELLAAWTRYESTMLPHLEEEERVCLPLMRAYFTPQEIAPIVQDIVKSGPPVEMGSFIHYTGDEAFFEFMKQEGIPGFVWYVDFKSKRNNFENIFKRNIDSLISGTPPVVQNRFLCC